MGSPTGSPDIFYMYEKKYISIAEKIKEKIQSGVYSGKLPGERALAAEYRVNHKTINSAVNVIASEGYVRRIRGRGAFIKALHKTNDTETHSVIALFLKGSGDVYGPMSLSLARIAQEKGFMPILTDIDSSDFIHNQQAYVTKALAQNPRAVVIEGRFDNLSELTLRKFETAFPKTLFVESFEFPYRLQDATYVLCSYGKGSYAATKHLLERGHKKILYLGPVSKFPDHIYPHTTHAQVLSGCRSAMDEAGLAGCLRILFDDGDIRKTLTQLKLILSENRDRPTAVFSFGDSRLYYALPVIRQLGMRIPEDLALAGFFNTPWCDFLDIPLTSVSIREDELAQLAVAQINNKKSNESIFLEPKLIIRKSS